MERQSFVAGNYVQVPKGGIAGVFSGGGAKGMFIVGYLSAIFKMGIRFDYVSGVSVGALIAALVAQDDFDKCEEVFNTITAEDIHKKYSLVSTIYRLLVEKRSGLYSARGLNNLVHKYVDRERVKMPVYTGFVSLQDRMYYSLNREKFASSVDYADAVLASALMPIIWEDIPEIRLANGKRIRRNVDGGLRNNTPLSDILHHEPSQIYVIQCSKPYEHIGGESETEPLENKGSKMPLINNAAVTLEIMLDEIVRNDTEGLLRINNLVGQARDKGVELVKENGEPYKCYEAHIVQPKESLGNTLDFSRTEMIRRYSMGYAQAVEDHQSLNVKTGKL